MKNVYLVQPSAMLNNSVYLPYSVGCIAAYSFTKKNITDIYALQDFIFFKSPVEDVVKKMHTPFIVGFSCYMWNIDYNLALAKRIKAEWPDSCIVFGGPQVPNDSEILEEHAFVDILIHGEGEVTFYELLNALAENKTLDNVHNISYRSNGTLLQTENLQNESLDDFPSPYTTGLFDYIVNDPAYKGIQFDTVLETTRGCPFKTCVFCCWSGVQHKFRTFPEERVIGDLNWMAANKICFCICADSNFGILDRDEKIADYITQLKMQYGYPQKFETIATKNKSDLTFRINSKLETAKLNRGISLAIQSFSPDVLKIIGRQNIPYENFAKELTRYRNGGMYTYTDLILGLPGETLDSFCGGMFEVIEAGQHDSININRCELLPNSKMYEKDFVEAYKIKTIRSGLCQNHSKVSENTLNSSRSQLVVETSTLPMQDWRTALRISVCVQSFHCFGLLKFLAIYLRKAKNLSYYDFYMNLYTWIEHESSFVKKTVDTVCKSIDTFLRKEGDICFFDYRFGDMYWDFQEGLFLLCAVKAGDFYAEIKEYVSQYFTDADLFDDIFNYQKEIIALPLQNEKYIACNYAWDTYFGTDLFSACKHPAQEKILLKIIPTQTDTLEAFAKEVVWYGKRNGRTVNKTIRMPVQAD